MKTIVLSTILSTALFAQMNTEVVVTANKTKQSIKDVTSQIEVITKEDIQERHFSDITELLSNVSGINFTKNGGLGSSTSILLRGMGSSRTLVLIDGVRYQDPSSTSGASFAHLDMANVERVEILKGANSSIWGADAGAGVVNIITKSGSQNSATLELGSYGTKKVSASLGEKNKNYSFVLNASRVSSDSFSSRSEKSSDREEFEKDSYKNTTINLKSKFFLNESTDLKFASTFINASSEYDGYKTNSSFVFDPVLSANDDTLRSRANSKLFSMGVDKRYGIHNISLSHSISDFKREEIGTSWGVKDFNGKTAVTEIFNNFKYDSFSGEIVAGAKIKDTDVDYKEASGKENRDDFTSTSLFVSNQNRFGNVIFNQSLRQTNLSDFENKTTGKVGGKLELSKELSLSANYGSAYNAPNLIHVLNPWGASNPNLKPETIKSFDIGVSYNKLSLTYFEQKVDNLLFWNKNGTSYDFKDDFYDNGDGVSNIKGFEISLKQELPALRSLVAMNYTSLDAKDKFGKDLARRPKSSTKVSFDHYPNGKIHFNINGEHIGERYDGADKAGKQTGKYTLFNSVINYKIQKSVNTYLKIENILDKDYQVIDGYATAGRSYNAGVNVTF